MGSPLPPGPPQTTAPFTGRAAYALSQLYYYLAAIVAVGFVIGGAIARSSPCASSPGRTRGA